MIACAASVDLLSAAMSLRCVKGFPALGTGSGLVGSAWFGRMWSACVNTSRSRTFTTYVTALTIWCTTPSSHAANSPRTVFTNTWSPTSNTRSLPRHISRCSFNLSCLACIALEKSDFNKAGFARGWRLRKSSGGAFPVTLLGVLRYARRKLSRHS